MKGFHLFNRGFMADRPGRSDDPSRQGLDRALTARQLAWRKWATLALAALLAALPGALLGLALQSIGVPPSSALALAFAATAVAAVAVSVTWPFGLPRVWQPLGDAEMVQLLEMARFYSRVGALVHQVNEQGRDFTLQDWLQARAIEHQVGRDRQAVAAVDAHRMLRAGPRAWAQSPQA